MAMYRTFRSDIGSIHARGSTEQIHHLLGLLTSKPQSNPPQERLMGIFDKLEGVIDKMAKPVPLDPFILESGSETQIYLPPPEGSLLWAVGELLNGRRVYRITHAGNRISITTEDLERLVSDSTAKDWVSTP